MKFYGSKTKFGLDFIRHVSGHQDIIQDIRISLEVIQYSLCRKQHSVYSIIPCIAHLHLIQWFRKIDKETVAHEIMADPKSKISKNMGCCYDVH